MRKRGKKYTAAGTILLFFILLATAFLGQNEEKVASNQAIQNEINTAVTNGNLQVYYIDVGQADSILVQCDGQNMLIDAGTNEAGEDVVNFLKERQITKLDYLLGTHPHEDHIGGLDDVIDNFTIGTIYLPDIQTNTKTFEDVLDAAANKDLTITTPKVGDNFSLGQANLEVMSSILDEDNLNLSSLVLRMVYGENSFLFMGDAEVQNEQERNWPQTQILKVGHHGSDTSTSQEFLNQVKPEVAVISVGKDNSYGHPNQEILNRLQQMNVEVYRTDLDGTICISSDGKNYTVQKIEKNVND